MAAAVSRAYSFNSRWGARNTLHPASLGNMDVLKGFTGKKGAVEKIHPAAYLGNPTASSVSVNSTVAPSKKMDELCTFIFRHGDERLKARALLCAVFYHAIHDRFAKARDMFLMSHIQDSVDKADIKTQILYNRTVATLGLCAFRAGNIVKAHDLLSGLTGRVKELLAQGVTKQQEKDVEQEKTEKRRQMPYHMHINPDLLECCYLISAMFLDLPLLCKYPGSSNTPYRAFRKHYAHYNKQIFTGPPENSREHILAAAKAMMSGDAQQATELICKLEVWNLLPGDGCEALKQMLAVKIKEESLGIYMLTAVTNYESIALSHLCRIFNFEPAAARRVVNKMIFNRDITAAWDLTQDLLIIYRVEVSTISSACLQLADKLNMVVESNEKQLDPMIGCYNYKDDSWQRDGRGKNATDTMGSGAAARKGMAGGAWKQVTGSAQFPQWKGARLPYRVSTTDGKTGPVARTGGALRTNRTHNTSHVWGSGRSTTATGSTSRTK